MLDQTSKKLAVSIDRLSNDHGAGYHEPSMWIRWLCEDVLAGLGRRLKQPWSDAQRQRLFDLSGLYGEAARADPWADILGPVYMDVASRWKRSGMGQFFTPWPVAQCMAKLTINPAHLLSQPGYVRIGEPACGSGVMLLAVCAEVAEQVGSDGIAKLSLDATDRDQLCALMCATQVAANALLHAAPGHVEVWCANSLAPADAQEDAELVWGYHTTPDARPAQEPRQLVLPLDTAA